MNNNTLMGNFDNIDGQQSKSIEKDGLQFLFDNIEY